MTTPAKVEVLIRVASQLISVLEQEVEYLREMKSSKVASLQAEKMKLVVAYEEHVRELAAAPDMLKKSGAGTTGRICRYRRAFRRGHDRKPAGAFRRP